MRVVYRQQNDGKELEFSELSAIHFNPDDDVTRQEHKRETEIDYILSRYGLPPQQQGRYGETDSTVDLQEAIRLQNELHDAFQRLPEALQRQYGSWGSIIAAADRGELTPEQLGVVDAEQNRAVPTDKPAS